MTKKETKKKKPSKNATSKKIAKKTTATQKRTNSHSKKTTSTTNRKNTSPKLSKEKKQLKHSNLDRDNALLQTIVEGMQEKKANNITILDLQKIENSFCNFFVICEADSKPQLQAITDSVEEFTQKKMNIRPHHIEGVQNAEWILLDYLTIVVHIFRSDRRSFYKLEELWADAKIQHI